MLEHRRKIHEMLLPKTIEYARRSIPAYQGRFAAFDKPPTLVEHLAPFPLLYKQDLLNDPQAFRNAALKTTFLQHTSGTTGTALLMHRCQEEVDFHFRHARALFEVPAATEQVIRISVGRDSGHGTLMPTPVFVPVFHLDLDDWLWRSELPRILSRPWEYACCEPAKAVVGGLEPSIRRLTVMLAERGFDFASASVLAVAATGELVTPYRRCWYEKTWKVPFYDRYSMSEVQAGAEMCPQCGLFHMEPSVVVEVVDPVSCQQIVNGVGGLVVTTLYPFIQKQPLIRYWTGDIVETGLCPTHGLGFRPLGRQRDTVVVRKDGRAAVVLAPALLADLLESNPYVARVGTDGEDVEDKVALGRPACRVEVTEESAMRIMVRFRPSYSPLLHPALDKEVCASLREGLLAAHSNLREAIDGGKVCLEVESCLDRWIMELRPGMITS